jgi:predicted RNase H-like nuclease (RuvC/YqgF family)
MRIATHPEAIKHLVKIGMAADISEHIKMVESANESLIKEKDELRSVAEDNKRECEATRIENARLKAEVEELTGLLKASTYYNTSDEVNRLKAEVERLTWASQGSVKYVDHTMALARQSMEHHKQVSRLEAQVERLTKAGDAMVFCINLNSSSSGIALRNWEAAKEGKPRA